MNRRHDHNSSIDTPPNTLSPIKNDIYRRIRKSPREKSRISTEETVNSSEESNDTSEESSETSEEIILASVGYRHSLRGYFSSPHKRQNIQQQARQELNYINY